MFDLIDIGANLDSRQLRRRPRRRSRARRGRRRHPHHRDGNLRHEQRAGGCALRRAPNPLCSRRPACIHTTPSELDSHTVAALRSLLASSAIVVAVGECGLDFFRDYSPRDAQRRAFAAQLELAAEVRKPVFLHQRDAHDEFVAMLKPARATTRRRRRALLHRRTGRSSRRTSTSSSISASRVGFATTAEAPSCAPPSRGSALDRLLVETDAPYPLPRDLKPKPQSRRNEPQFVAHVLERVAALMSQPVDVVARATTANAERLSRPRAA